MKKIIYLIYSDSHGLEDVVTSVEKAKRLVETISRNDYGLTKPEEIWDEDYINGNELCYYQEMEVGFDD